MAWSLVARVLSVLELLQMKGVLDAEEVRLKKRRRPEPADDQTVLVGTTPQCVSPTASLVPHSSHNRLIGRVFAAERVCPRL